MRRMHRFHLIRRGERCCCLCRTAGQRRIRQSAGTAICGKLLAFPLRRDRFPQSHCAAFPLSPRKFDHGLVGGSPKPIAITPVCRRATTDSCNRKRRWQFGSRKPHSLCILPPWASHRLGVRIVFADADRADRRYCEMACSPMQLKTRQLNCWLQSAPKPFRNRQISSLKWIASNRDFCKHQPRIPHAAHADSGPVEDWLSCKQSLHRKPICGASGAMPSIAELINQLLDLSGWNPAG